jgi:hypothetical protein
MTMPIAKTALTPPTKTDDAPRVPRAMPEAIASQPPRIAEVRTLDESDDQYDNVACTD